MQPLALEKIEQLNQLRDNIKGNIKKGAEAIFEAGRDLKAAKELVGHGNYGRWLADNFEEVYDLSVSSAQRFVDVYERFQKNFTTMKQLPIGKTFLYLLAAPSTPQSAVDEIVDIVQGGQQISKTEARVIIEQHQEGVRSLAHYVEEHAPAPIAQQVITGHMAVRNAYEITKAAESASDPVRSVVATHGVASPEVISVLEKFAEKEPDELNSIERTGLVQFEGEKAPPPIPIAQATPAQVDDAYKSIRAEGRTVEWESTRPVRHVSYRNAEIVDLGEDEEGYNVVTFRIDDACVHALDKVVGQRLHLIVQDLIKPA